MTEEETTFFYENGYLIKEKAYDTQTVESMRREADFILELILNSSIHSGRMSHRLDLTVTDEGLPMVRKIQPIDDLSRTLHDVAMGDILLDSMRAMMNDEPILMEEKLNYKQPLGKKVDGLKPQSSGDHFPIHQDWAYYAHNGYPQEIVSSAICLDDCTPENGPLRIWPGSHKKALEHAPREGIKGLHVVPGSLDEDGGMDVCAPAGTVMYFHSLLAHNSRKNTSNSPRRIMIYSHYPKAANMGHDIRNGPNRLRESGHEWDYVREVGMENMARYIKAQ
jgi:ectoine hydroxylase-related dioxygenase (phytanoyl-CoA dioxygenase family)